MKKFLIVALAGFLALLATNNGAYAQSSINPELLEPQKNTAAVEKAVNTEDQKAVMSAINANTLKNFSKAYKNANGAKWEKSNEGASVRFDENGINTLVFYDGKGRWKASLKGYMEAKMPTDLRKSVKREFYDYAITYVQEAEMIDSQGKPTYIIHLEDQQSIKLIRIYDGEMELWQEYKKQS